MTLPLYKHDCDQCSYLGPEHGERGPVDLYHCSKGPTVLARLSSEHGDYMSGLRIASGPNADPLLAEAARRAQAANLPVSRP